MPLTIDRNGADALDRDLSRRHGGPVVLATFEDAPFDAQAARLAVESAADMRSTLFVVDVLEVRSARHAARRGAAPLAAAHAEAFEAVEELAADLGVTVEAARMPSRHPAADLVEFIGLRRPALVGYVGAPCTDTTGVLVPGTWPKVSVAGPGTRTTYGTGRKTARMQSIASSRGSE